MNTLTLTNEIAVERATIRPVATRPFATIVKTVKALGEGFAAYRRYELLRARGVPHADAAARAFEA